MSLLSSSLFQSYSGRLPRSCLQQASIVGGEGGICLSEKNTRRNTFPLIGPMTWRCYSDTPDVMVTTRSDF